MKKTEIQIDLSEIPEELQYIFKDTKVYDSSSHPTMRVLYSELGYYVKIAEKGSLAREAEMTRMFENNGMGVSVVSYFSVDKDYMVTKPATGEDALKYLDDPERLCRVLAEAMKKLHSMPVVGAPISPCQDIYNKLGKGEFLKLDTFIHGDFCLPNVILEDWKFSSFIDLGLAGVGDRHIDIYWVLWSLNYNLKTDKYTDLFMELYGRENIDTEILKIVAEVEATA
ncbi:MAG: phosphotransferase [Oscillospiraceae bacterium]|nr:phosphotransferase [Oscillospiraceae bacterium]